MTRPSEPLQYLPKYSPRFCSRIPKSACHEAAPMITTQKLKSCHQPRKTLPPSPMYLSTFSWREFSLRSHASWSLCSSLPSQSRHPIVFFVFLAELITFWNGPATYFSSWVTFYFPRETSSRRAGTLCALLTVTVNTSILHWWLTQQNGEWRCCW